MKKERIHSYPEEKKDYSHQKKILFNFLYLIIGIMIIIGVIFFYGFGFIQDMKNTPKVLASVNGEEITQEELEETKGTYLNLGVTGENLTKEEVLEEMIVIELLYQEAQKKGYNYTSEEIEEMLSNQLSMQEMTLDDFKEQINSQNLSYKLQIEKYQKQIAIQDYLEEEISESEFKVTEQEARDYYNNYLEQNPELGENQEIQNFDEIKEQVITILEEQKKQEVIQNLIQDLKEDAIIEYY
mgnify:CR=1 FL=1